MGQRGQRQIGRAPDERVAHQRDGRHRLEVAIGQDHALGDAGRAPGADDHHRVVGRLDGFDDRLHAVEPGLQRRPERGLGVQADQQPQLRQVGCDPLDQRGERTLEDQGDAVEEVELGPVLIGLVARVDRAPDGAGPRDPEDAGEGDRVVAGQDRDLVAGPDPRAAQAPCDLRAQALHLPVGQRLVAGHQARLVGAQRSPLVEVVDQAHGRRPQTCVVTTGSSTRPKLRSTPSSSRCPKAWQPEAKPARFGALLQQGVRRVGLQQPGLLVVAVAVDDAVRPARAGPRRRPSPSTC